MRGAKPVGARAGAVSDLQRQISMAVRMCKKIIKRGVSWNLGLKWIENHLDVLIEAARELKKMPEDAPSANGHESTPQSTAQSSVEISRKVAEQQGSGSRQRQSKPPQEPVGTHP